MYTNNSILEESVIDGVYGGEQENKETYISASNEELLIIAYNQGSHADNCIGYTAISNQIASPEADIYIYTDNDDLLLI